MLMHMCAMALMHLTNTVCAHCLWFEDELKKRSMSMFKPPGASVPSWKISRCSSRSRVAVSPFTCLVNHRHSHVMDVVVFGKIAVFGHGEPTLW